MSRVVSITLQNTDAARPIIDAITADNPGLVVNAMPGIVKIDREGSLIIRRESVESRIGRTWDPQELHLCIVSMAGNVDEDDDYFALAWAH
ncbi:phenol hydroxylase P2 protein [Azospirillum fermentarium]|uniref:MmoB/DmpM family protein n=1 Tax=Azospirillum fermentarium TaxID=1233114 RepID=UPI002227DCBD|nr:MmoB/DmpM family protein [Azospirillum fermentarium]MCW2248957.1 phenol hydroxylase P2 protein [Azospirillum fermentarium]